MAIIKFCPFSHSGSLTYIKPELYYGLTHECLFFAAVLTHGQHPPSKLCTRNIL